MSAGGINISCKVNGEAIEERNANDLPILREEFKEGQNYNRIKVPHKVTEDLAENVGMHISDGSMHGTYEITYSGHAIDDFPYLLFRFIPLIRKLWGTSRIGYKFVSGQQTLKIRINSKQLFLFKHNILGLPYGKKETITIPKYFVNNKQITRTLIRSLFDGDGSICFKSKSGLGHTYPVISYSSLSKPLIEQLQKLLGRLSFTLPEKIQTKNAGTTFILFLNGDKNYELWMNTIGFNNPKHLTKVALYEIFGMVPPNTGLVERVKLIRGDLKLSAIYPVKNMRVNIYRVLEKRVLSELNNQTCYINELGNKIQVDRQRIRYTLRRLSKMRFVECVKATIGGRKYYQITQRGLNKLKRVNSIVKRLRDEFNLAV